MKAVRLLILLSLIFCCLLTVCSCDGTKALPTPSDVEVDEATLELNWKSVNGARLLMAVSMAAASETLSDSTLTLHPWLTTVGLEAIPTSSFVPPSSVFAFCVMVADVAIPTHLNFEAVVSKTKILKFCPFNIIMRNVLIVQNIESE